MDSMEKKLKADEDFLEAMGSSNSSSKNKQIKKLLNKIDNLRTKYEKNKKLSRTASGMERKAKNNECINARKCKLVSYNSSRNTDGNLDTQLGRKGGCCPGQTGHHLVPNSWAENNCEGKYSEGGAPVVCVEGFRNDHGSHGKIHDAMDDEVLNKREEFEEIIRQGLNNLGSQKTTNITNNDLVETVFGKNNLNGNWRDHFDEVLKESKINESLETTISEIHKKTKGMSQGEIDDEIAAAAKKQARVDTGEAIEMAASSHQKIADHCNRDCIVAQLKLYYKDAGCKPMRPSTKDEENKIGPTKDNGNTDW